MFCKQALLEKASDSRLCCLVFVIIINYEALFFSQLQAVPVRIACNDILVMNADNSELKKLCFQALVRNARRG